MSRPVLPKSPWTHALRAEREIQDAVAHVVRRPRPYHSLSVNLRRPEPSDGCWCYVGSERPHPHEPGLGKCPAEPAMDAYLWLEIVERTNG
ncbi:MAG: hypothetical protein KGL35_08175 [Bradyrhizobium sp.]|nr:hypothetical protein [Bradyrhizobium sp.]